MLVIFYSCCQTRVWPFTLNLCQDIFLGSSTPLSCFIIISGFSPFLYMLQPLLCRRQGRAPLQALWLPLGTLCKEMCSRLSVCSLDHEQMSGRLLTHDLCTDLTTGSGTLKQTDPRLWKTLTSCSGDAENESHLDHSFIYTLVFLKSRCSFSLLLKTKSFMLALLSWPNPAPSDLGEICFSV